MKELYLFHRKYLSKLKYAVILVYIFFMPCIETPYWCLAINVEEKVQDTFLYDCQVNYGNYLVKHSEIIDLNPIIAGSIDILCLIFFSYFRWFKSRWSLQGRKDMCRNIFFAVLCTISVTNFSLAAFGISSTFYADLLRPFVVINFLGTMRNNTTEFFMDVKASFAILITIFAYIFVFALVGFYLFGYSFEGFTYFGDLSESYVNMLTLLTTANFPDVMLPAYHKNFFYCLFFVLYLTVGLFFLLNLMLASVFNKYKGRLE